MKKRKHRIVVDITFDEPCTEKDAISRLDFIIDGTMSDFATFMTNWSIKSFGRVFAAEKKKIENAEFDKKMDRIAAKSWEIDSAR